MRKRHFVVILLFALLHFSLLALAFWQGFIIFRGPSTPREVFWAHAINVLLFPANLVIPRVSDHLGQSVLMVMNSLLWGIVFGSVYLKLRKSP